MNSLADLQIFMAVVNADNFSGAARTLGLPPSSVSRRIAAVEANLGVKLFKRTTRDVVLTDAGRAYSLSVARILQQLQEADLAVSRLSQLPEGCLRIESRPGLAAWLLAPLLPRFLAMYPAIQVDLRLTNDTLETISPGTDIGIRYGLARPSSLMTRKLVTTRQAIYAAPAYLARHGVPSTPEDLHRHNCLVFANGDTPVSWRFRKGDYDEALDLRGNLLSNDVNTLATAVANGLGIAVNHEWVAEAGERDGRVVRILRDYEVTTMDSFDMQVCALYAPAMRQVQKVRVFLDFMQGALRGGQAAPPGGSPEDVPAAAPR